jgi:hypothetical protein
MADTIQSVDYFLNATTGALKNNTTGAITEQVARDLALSAYRPHLLTPGGRLTLESGVGVSTADQTAKSTLYYTPYLHGGLSLYDGTSWKVYTLAEMSLALSGLTSGKNYDVFVYDNAGTLTLELSAAWTNDTTRADALAKQDGVQVKSGSTTRLWLGTIRTTGTTTTEDSAGGSTTQVGGKRFVWNAHNRVARPLAVIDTANSWSYFGSGRVADGATAPANCVEYVAGAAGGRVAAKLLVTGATEPSEQGDAGVGHDSTSAMSGLRGEQYLSASFTALRTVHVAFFEAAETLGYHYLAWLERSQSGSFIDWYGDDGQSIQSGLYASVEG